MFVSEDSEPLSGIHRDSLSQKVGSSTNDSCQSAKSKFTRTRSSSVGNQNCQSGLCLFQLLFSLHS